ncbi:MAG: DUF5719 family protein [Actinomycetota bacterium]
MSLRGLLALLAVALVVVGGFFLDSVTPRAAHGAPPATSSSGAWYCPHGGGKGWHVEIAVTNPGDRPVEVRVTTFGRGAPLAPSRITVPPLTEVRVPVKAETRGAATELEYFDGWVGASWLAQAHGNESGLAAEPCTRSLGKVWLLPDGTTVRGEDAWVVVMNPAAAPAIFTIRLVTEREAVVTKQWTDVLLRPGRSTSFHLNQFRLGKRTVAAEIETSIGRVAAASLGASSDGGIRSVIGIPAPQHAVVLPGGPETSRSDLVVADAGPGRATYDGSLLREDGRQTLGQFRAESLQADQARTYDIPTQPVSSIEVDATTDAGLAVARRTFGPGADQGSTAGAAPSAAWVVASAAVSPKDGWRLMLANPGSETASVTLWLVSAAGLSEKLSPRLVNVGAGESRLVAEDFTAGARLGSVVAVATSGTFVPLAASSTGDGAGYATAVGVPIPGRWIPALHKT